MNCHKCGSQNLKKYAFICDEGTSTEDVYATVKPKWGSKPFSSSTKTITGTRTVKTALAQQCSPPVDPSDSVTSWSVILGLVLGLYLGLSAGAAAHMFWVGLAAFVLTFGFSIYGCRKLWLQFMGGSASMQRYKKNLYFWHHSWLCMQCGSGTIFTPE